LLNLLDKGALEMHRWVDAPSPEQVAVEAVPPPAPAAQLRLAAAAPSECEQPDHAGSAGTGRACHARVVK
jgi:hypothetical protein